MVLNVENLLLLFTFTNYISVINSSSGYLIFPLSCFYNPIERDSFYHTQAYLDLLVYRMK